MAVDVDLQKALVDVRRAYRLVWSYQRRVFDLVQLIADQFEQHTFYVWETNGRERPVQRTTNPLRKWAWDLLPLYDASFLFLPAGVDFNAPRQGEWMLEIHVNADTGFDDDVDGEPDSVDFEDAAESSSNLRLYAWQCTGDVDTNWNRVWRANEWPEEDKTTVEHASAHFRIIGQFHDLAELPDEQAIETAVIAFKALLATSLGIEG